VQQCFAVEIAGRHAQMAEYQGYTIKQNPATGKWEIFWQEKKQEGEYARQADAEEWIDDQFPLNR
jgi:hypothetical protein